VNRATPSRRQPRRALRGHRRGFNLVELLIALAISAALLAATMVALDASFTAYQSTTEWASTQTIGRLTMHRMLALIRTGVAFGPVPINPNDSLVQENYIEIITRTDQYVKLEWIEVPDADHPVGNALWVEVDSDPPRLLLEGVMKQEVEDPPGSGTMVPVPPFTMEYELGRRLYRATIDLMVIPDDNQSVTIEGDNSNQVIRLVASVMPRMEAY
jgi:prepilin-type N-terminal cleavage/methylation domain-containing protein